MNIPRFWASANGEADTSAGRATPLRCFGWSDHDLGEARSRAAATLARLLERIKQGADFPDSYAYTDRPIREEILEEMRDANGKLEGLITRNAYGALVLNTSGVMFVDIDAPGHEVKTSTQGGGDEPLLQRLLGWFAGKPRPAALPPAPAPSAVSGVPEVPEAVARFSQSHPDWSLRCYRTFAGWRLLVTHATFDPVSIVVRQALADLGSDPKYRKLTHAQKCFRARLTPKPWRCDVDLPMRVYPRETPALQQAHQRWLAGYERACNGFAACRYVTTFGSGDTCAAAETTVLWHDRLAKANESLPLA